MKLIRVKSKAKTKQEPELTSSRNREEDVIELIQKITDLKVTSQHYLGECGYCCKTGAFGKEFTDFMRNNKLEKLCDNSCTNCRVKYYNFVQELVAKRLSKEYQVDFKKVMDGLSEYE